MSAIKSYKDLDVWKAAIELATDVYGVTKGFPKEEIYGLTSQMRRASVSIASNIAEGYGRESTAQFVQFLRISQGSSKELETQILIAERVGTLGSEQASTLMKLSDDVGKMLRGLIRALEAKSRDQ